MRRQTPHGATVAGPSGDFDHCVALGDAARDAGRWADAAEHYAAALRARPTSSGIWVQLGHAYKECGNFVRAETAYRKAHALQPDDSDLLVQLGHFYAVRHDRAKATEFYRLATMAGSTDQHALLYLARFNSPGGTDLAGSVNQALPAIYFDYSDLLAYVRSNRNPTGIQRVQIELFKASLQWPSPIPILACAFAQRLGSWVEINRAELRNLTDLAAIAGAFDDPDWQEALAEFFAAFDARDACHFPIGAALINTGTSWWISGYMSAIRAMKARYGMRYVAFVHDLIPVMAPEYVVSGVVFEFNSWLSSAFLHADLFVGTSRSTLDDLVRASRQVCDLAYTPVAMPLDTATASARGEANEAQTTQILQRLGLSYRRFVLFVGTLEERKNHLLVFQAWAKLTADGDPDRVPQLVCVGKSGWKFDAAQAFLGSHPELASWIVFLSGISDNELATLYERCLFTVYASHYEGWGLPVTESLCHGKACLTTDHSSLPEAGGKFADYYEAGSMRSFQAKQHQLIFDDAYRESRELLIQAEFKPRTWHDALAGLVEGVTARFQSVAVPKALAAPIMPGTIYRLGQRPFAHRLDRDSAIAEMLRFDQAWYNVGTDITWSKALRARLGFHIPASVTSDLLVFLKIHAPPAQTTLIVQLAGATLSHVNLEPDQSRFLRLDVPPDALSYFAAEQLPATLHLQVDRLTPTESPDWAGERDVGIGVELFMACLPDDADARLAIIECSMMTLEDA
jgi:glycosyltransferase involved in cell wall biosynthesis